MSSKVSKETLYEGVHAVMQVFAPTVFFDPNKKFTWFLSERQGQAKKVPRDGRPPNRSEELRSPEGQAFLWHRQVRVHLRLY